MNAFFQRFDVKRSVFMPGAVLFAILLVINIISTNRFFRIDLTDNNIFSLSSSSKSVVAEIDDLLTMKVYFSDDLPGEYANNRRYLQDILEEYAAISRGNIKFEFASQEKLEEEEFLKISRTIPEILENRYVNDNNSISAFQLGYWYEKISPEIDFEKSYLWYSVSVSSGVYKAMKMRDRVGKLIEKKKITEIQLQANEILTKNTYFNSKKDVEWFLKFTGL